ncbi:MAG: peptidoglycan-binding protein [Bryobacteraceae bacterium]
MGRISCAVVAVMACAAAAPAQQPSKKPTAAVAGRPAAKSTAKPAAPRVAAKSASSKRPATAATHKPAARTTLAHKTTGAKPKAGVASRGHSKKTPYRSASARRGRRARAAPRRPRQMVPAPERYKEIQQALVSKGYLKPEEASGVWDQNSSSALKRFQNDQKLLGTGKIDSLSLIALGLGPKHDAAEAKPSPALVPDPTSPQSR